MCAREACTSQPGRLLITVTAVPTAVLQGEHRHTVTLSRLFDEGQKVWTLTTEAKAEANC